MSAKTILLSAVLILITPLAANANICEDVNDMANGWNQMADGVDDLDLDELSPNDIREINSTIQDAIDTTHEFAELLQDEGDSREQKLGWKLTNALDELSGAADIEETVYYMDGVVDSLDKITDYCDQA